jgi:hypothetical protein
MSANNSPWTPELQARVLELSKAKVPRSRIGEMTGLSKNQITGWLDRQAHPERTTYAWRRLGLRDYYDGPTTLDRLQAYQDKLNAARWWPEFVNMVHGTIVLRYPAPFPSANLSRA